MRHENRLTGMVPRKPKMMGGGIHTALQDDDVYSGSFNNKHIHIEDSDDESLPKKGRKEKFVQAALKKTGNRAKTNTVLRMTKAEKVAFDNQWRANPHPNAFATLPLSHAAVTIRPDGKADYYKRRPGQRQLEVGIDSSGRISHYGKITGLAPKTKDITKLTGNKRKRKTTFSSSEEEKET